VEGEGAAAEGVLGVEDNVLGLVPYKEPVGFLFSQISFTKLCRVCEFDFLNSVLTKNLEKNSSIFRIFYFNFLNFQI
jgi:hypothetical protein